MIAAATAFAAAAAAAITTATALASPLTPAHHTINVVTPPAATYSSSETQAAKASACAAWDQAARSLASAGKLRATTAEPNGSSPEAKLARDDEKRVGVTSIAYLRTKIRPGTPDPVLTSVETWIATQVDRLHAVNMRDWDASNSAADRANELVSKIVTGCGLR